MHENGFGTQQVIDGIVALLAKDSVGTVQDCVVRHINSTAGVSIDVSLLRVHESVDDVTSQNPQPWN